MITRNSAKLIFLILILFSNPVFALMLLENYEDYISQSSNISDFIQDRNSPIQFFLNSSSPLGMPAPYAQYNLITDLSPVYITMDENLRMIIDTAIKVSDPEVIETRLLPHYLGMVDLKTTLVYLIKSPYYQGDNLNLPQEKLQQMRERERLLYEIAFEVFEKIPLPDREYIRAFNTTSVEPDVKDWPKFSYIEDAHREIEERGILRDKVDYTGIEGYKEEIERAVIASIAGFNYETDRPSLDWASPSSEKFTAQAINDFHQRIEYWLKSGELIPQEKFSIVKEKAIELFNSLSLKRGLFPTSPWRGEIAEIYRILRGVIPTQAEMGRFAPYLDWGEDIYKRPVDISTYIEEVDSDFGVLRKGPTMTLEQLRDKITKIGPAIVGIKKPEGMKFVKVVAIERDFMGRELVYYDDFYAHYFMELETEFLPSWDGLVWIPEEKTEFAKIISDFDDNPESYSLIKGYGQWTINRFDALASRIGRNINIPYKETLPYFYTLYQVGGEETFPYAGYYQTGLWLTFNEGIKPQLLRGTALVFDAYISDYSQIKYIKIELKEDETGRKIAEFIIPRKQLNLEGWNNFKIPIHYYLPGTLSLTVGVISSYPDFYNPQNYFLAIDRIYVE